MTFSNFFDSLGDLDWLAVLAGTVAVFALGWLWYGPLFGKTWARENGVSADGSFAPKEVILGFVQFLVLNIGIAYFIPALHLAFQNPPSFETLVMSSIALRILVVGAFAVSSVVWMKKSWTGFAIDAGFAFVGIALASWVQDLVA